MPFEVFMIFSNMQNDTSRNFELNAKLLVSNTILIIYLNIAFKYKRLKE